MSDPLAAADFWPLILQLPYDERVRLAKRALRAAATGEATSAAYVTASPAPDEISSDGEPLAWEGEGWAELGAPQEGGG